MSSFCYCIGVALVDDLLREWRANARRWEPVARQARRSGLRVFNPGAYGFPLYERFLRGRPPRPGAALLLGLNPGPYGMGMTGIPFTDCRTAEAALELPARFPGRAPKGLLEALRAGGRRRLLSYERSSLVLYRFLRETFGDLEEAFARCYILNPCPLLFIAPDGANVTPAHPALRRIPAVQALRERALDEACRLLRPGGIVCLGADVGDCLAEAASRGCPGRVLRYPHPARAIPAEWARGLAREIGRSRWA